MSAASSPGAIRSWHWLHNTRCRSRTRFPRIRGAGDDRVEVRIRDNGTGIPPDIQEKIFNPFFTTKPAGEGTGLGLSMSHDIVVKQHGGTIDVVTELGLFREFIITLPRVMS